MYYLVVCLCWAAVALAAPAPPDVLPLEKQQPTVIPIVSQSDELEPNGTYKFSYETGNGIKREETSYDKVIPKARGKSAPSDSNEGGESDGDSDEIHVQQGSYSYTAPDGTLISVRYIADENGFQPIGDHIPRVPSVSGGGSGEKSGRALDNAEAGSAPVVAARSAFKPEEKPTAAKAAPPPAVAAPESKKPEESAGAESSTAAAENESSTKPADAEASTTEAASKESTTEGASKEASTTEATSEASTTEAEKASETTEASTPAASTTTGESSTTTPAVEPSTTASESSTSEAATPTTPAA